MPAGRRDGAALTRSGRAAAFLLLLGLVPAALGYGLWRVARDQPLWLAPRLWSVSRARPAPVSLPPLVLAFHYPWYGTPSGPTGRWRHWNHARIAAREERILGFHDPRRAAGPERLDVGATHYPLNGPYDSLDPAVIREQIRDAQAGGIDGFVVSWWGRESEEAQTFAALLSGARGTGFRLAPYYEVGELWPRGGPGVAADLEALLDRHREEPALLRVGGDPVVFIYAAHRLRPPAWEYVLRRLHAGDRRAFLIADAARPAWLSRFDALHVYSPMPLLTRGRDPDGEYRARAAAAGAAGRPFMPAVAPGYDDRTIRVPGDVVPRANGATYDAMWAAALAVDPAWVLIASWNEWHEGTEIEPSREHGARYVEATRRWADRFRDASR
ncbi:MAG: endo-1,3-alpha-glucanase family glycosylhydrolase [Candidatus Rokuibacteriota bacterium]